MGPVQVLVVGFEHADFSGEVLAELARLREAGIVRLVDLLVVERHEDGTFETLDPAGFEALAVGELATAVLAHAEGDPDGEVDPLDTDLAAWSLEGAVPPGSVAAVALIEHLWAAPLTAAIDRAGGTPLEETWLAPREREALEALEAKTRQSSPSA
jgi:hypothetical protein